MKPVLQSLHKLTLISIIIFFVPLYTIFIHNFFRLFTENLKLSAGQRISGKQRKCEEKLQIFFAVL